MKEMETANTIEEIAGEAVTTTVGVYSAVRELGSRGRLTLYCDQCTVEWIGTLESGERSFTASAKIAWGPTGNMIDPFAAVILSLLQNTEDF